jgi:hypothetical protein
MDTSREMENPNTDPEDWRVLSVPAGITYAVMTEHNVYSCPANYSPHEPTVEIFAPRNEQGRIPRLYRIAARMVTDPTNPLIPISLNHYADSIRAYISVARNLPGILDAAGNYRFYILCDLENGALKHSPIVNPPGAAHVYLSLKELTGGAQVVHAIFHNP